MPTTDTSRTIHLLDTSGDGGGCGCGGCGCGSNTEAGRSTDTTTEAITTAATKDTATNTYAVTGMTCGHCASAVTSELKSLERVTDVTVDLVAGGTSSVTVTSTQTLDPTQVAAALEEAGDYQLA